MTSGTLSSGTEDHLRGVILVLVAGSFWSIAGVVVRLMHDDNEWQILFYRSVGLIVTLLIYLLLQYRGDLYGAFRTAGTRAMLAGAFLSVAFTFWIFAMTHTTIANALFVLSAAPFLAAILARIVLGERVRPATWGYMLMAAAGVGVMVGEGAVVGTLAGNLFALIAACGFAAFSVTLRQGRSVDMTPAVCWAGVWSGLIAAFMLLTTGVGFVVSSHDLMLCLLLGVVQVGLGLILFTRGSRHLPAAEITLLSLTEVVLGPIWVWLGVGEKPSSVTLLGGTIVLIAIAAQAIHGARSGRPPTPVVTG